MSRRIQAALAGVAFGLAATAAMAAQQTATNGILSVVIEDAGTSVGMFTVRTGASHPLPNVTVLFPIGTSYVTLRDNTAQVVYANAGGAATGNIAPYTFQSLQAAPCSGAVTTIAGGFRATYTCPNWTVTQDVVIAGSTLTDTNVRQSVSVQNTSGAARSYGVRYMWDWTIAGNDASVFRTRNPDGVFTSAFAAFDNPAFQVFEEVDNAAAPTLSVFGTVRGGALSPTPSTPDRLGYVSWSTADGSPWDFPISGSGADSATVHYWGYAAPLNLAAGATTTFHQYIATNPNAIGVGPTGPTEIPTLSEWALIALAGLVGLLGLRRARTLRV